MSEPRRIFWTIGHSDRSTESLIEILASQNIDRVVDVRSHPWSRRHPWHGRAELEQALRRAEIDYAWMGGSLGGMRPDGYPAYQQSEEYEQGLTELIRLGESGSVAILCAERDPWHCHRRFIADDLMRRGLRVQHLITGGEQIPHQPSLL